MKINRMTLMDKYQTLHKIIEQFKDYSLDWVRGWIYGTYGWEVKEQDMLIALRS